MSFWSRVSGRLHLICLSRFRESLEFDTVVVHAIQSDHQISTYRLLAVSEKHYQDKRARKQSEEKEIITETRRMHRARDDHLNLTSNTVSVFHLCFPESKLQKF